MTRASRVTMMSEKTSQAREFAVTAHGDQRYGTEPYSVHLDAIATLLQPFGEQAQIVGYLHDVAEDTPVTVQTIREIFGDLVADCVALVTDEDGANRKQRKALTNAKLAKVEPEHHLALIVKAADRLANLRASTGQREGSKLEMYRREHPEFRLAAYRPNLCEELWVEMDALLKTAD
ncbi:HD domain-containing protein [Zavarzinella formosa]|uniref:HD domain-containing protein n=1 Tax=Zavarzinella formosa TaxID=360055 RepID=UPI001EE63B50|nr:HD domain-containing protein [Zavarzinella formosa]